MAISRKRPMALLFVRQPSGAPNGQPATDNGPADDKHARLQEAIQLRNQYAAQQCALMRPIQSEQMRLTEFIADHQKLHDGTTDDATRAAEMKIINNARQRLEECKQKANSSEIKTLISLVAQQDEEIAFLRRSINEVRDPVSPDFLVCKK